MKKTIMGLLLTFVTLTAQAADVLKASADKSYDILTYVMGVQRTYSQTSDLTAKVFEILAGDGMNPTRMVLVLDDAKSMSPLSKTYELGIMMVGVRRVVFSDKDEVTINYSQDNFDKDGNNIVVNKSVKIKILRDQSGQLTDEVSIQ